MGTEKISNTEGFVEGMENIRRQVRIDGDHIVFQPEGAQNPVGEVPLSRCASIEEILAWVSHLGEKNWMTTRMLTAFIHRATSYHKIEVNWGV